MRLLSSSVFLLLLLLLGAACGGESSSQAAARRNLARGNLERAEQLLAGDDSPLAEELRKSIDRAREARAALEAEFERLAGLETERALVLLKAMKDEETDPVAVERIEVAISKTYDRLASQRSRTKHEKVAWSRGGYDRVPEYDPEGGGESPTGRVVSEDRASRGTLDRVYAEARRAMATREWSRGLNGLALIQNASAEEAREIRRLRDELLLLAEGELGDLLERADELERTVGLASARDHLLAERHRFPGSGRLARLGHAIDDLEGRIDILRIAELAGPGRSGSPVDDLEGEVPTAIRAGAYERVGELEAALDAWLEAAIAALPGPQRDRMLVRARALEQRLSLRDELREAFRTTRVRFDGLNVEAIEREHIRLREAVVPWPDVEVELIKKLARRIEISPEARAGLMHERLLGGDAEGALAEVAAEVRRGELDEAAAWELVALARDEAVPAGGYVFDGGRWLSAAEYADQTLLATLRKHERTLERGAGAKRDAALAALLEHGEVAWPAVGRALEARWQSVTRKCERGPTLKKLNQLSEQRAELDLRRKEALDLIFDEEEYFYPYRIGEGSPPVTSDKAARYPAVQRRVDELVGAVREVWAKPLEIKLAAGFRDQLVELAWIREQAGAVDLSLELPPKLPVWIWLLDPEETELGLHDLALSASEATLVRYNRGVLGLNRRKWEDLQGLEDAQIPGVEEQHQVEITNDYRMMFGRRALAWNPRIQDAAAMHSTYMANTGRFGHYEDGDPERVTPFDRMRLAGYPQGVSENVSMGASGPEGAHYGWLHSSGHHRNILMPGHREMASALSGIYWTQDFGVGTEFTSELD